MTLYVNLQHCLGAFEYLPNSIGDVLRIYGQDQKLSKSLSPSHDHLTCLTEVILVTFPVKVLVAQLYLTLCNPMSYNRLGSSIHGILQARILEWVAMPFSRGSPRPRDEPRSQQFRQIVYGVRHQGSHRGANTEHICSMCEHMCMCTFMYEKNRMTKGRDIKLNAFKEETYEVTYERRSYFKDIGRVEDEKKLSFLSK